MKIFKIFDFFFTIFICKTRKLYQKGNPDKKFRIKFLITKN